MAGSVTAGAERLTDELEKLATAEPRKDPQSGPADLKTPRGILRPEVLPAPAGKTDPRRWAQALAALGVVYGDIGTSPLYAFRECFAGARPLALTEANVLGILSLIVWSLILVVSIKYLLYVMRADNRGEGGILALLTLVAPRIPNPSRQRAALVVMGLFGAALLYGDGMITPAISVLSAIEGLEVATPAFSHLVVPIAVAILIGLFLLQRKGTGAVGAMFGPVTLVWFLTVAVLGLLSVVQTPHVLEALSPTHAARFFSANGLAGFLVLGAVFLVVTGGEALYADMGHFGLAPIRLAWFRAVFPALTLNYLGQGALLLRSPDAIQNPFYRLAPGWALFPLLVLATAATVIASQAVISGAFSLSRQALQLGFLPRLEVRHSSPHEIGQVYVPFVNWVLLVASVGLVLGFRSSSNLAGAYGVAVTTTMVVTTLLAFVLTRKLWGWSMARAAGLTGLFLVMDLSFLGANLVKVPQGGWFPLVVAAVVYILMTTWKRGRALLAQRLETARGSEEAFLESLANESLPRVPGTAVFMDSNPRGIPRALLHNIKHNRVIHEQVVLLTMQTDEVPRVPVAERLEIHEFQPRFLRAVAHWGYMENPKLTAVLEQLKAKGVLNGTRQTTVYLGRETLIVSEKPGLARWRKHLFALISRNAQRPTLHFGVSPGQVVELGLQVEL
ncbi:MAG: potassium transporter Kup [Thermoanaerobaculia bacterium]